MNNFHPENGLYESEIGLNQICTELSKYYDRKVTDLLGSRDIFSSEEKRELKKLINESKIHFNQIKKLLAYAKNTQSDVDKINAFQNRIKNVYNKRLESLVNVENNVYDVLAGMKLPNLNPEISSYLLNRGNYNLTGLTVRRVPHYDDMNTEIHEEMNNVIKKKLSVACLPPEELVFDINEGILKVESKSSSFVFEVTLYYNQERQEFDWFLFSFEHKLEKLDKMEKKIKRIQDEIAKAYKEGKKEQENYIIGFIVHKIKYYYTRKKLKSLLHSIELIGEQLKIAGSEEKFEVKQKKIAKDILYFEVCYWKDSLFHSLNPRHKYNCLIFQLKNLTMVEFLERAQVNDRGLYKGLSDEDILDLSHEPSLPSHDLIMQFITYTGHLTQLRVKQILLFGVSSRLRLANLSLNNTFIEIFEEVKVNFQVYQLLYYFSSIERLDIRDVSLVYRDIKEPSPDISLLKQKRMYLNIQVESKALLLFIDNFTGKLDILVEPPNKAVEGHKTRLKDIVWKDPLNLKELIVLFKKILLLNVFGTVLCRENARFHPQQGAREDNFKSACYKSNSLHLINYNNTVSQVRMVTFNKLIFDNEATSMIIQGQFSFKVTGMQNSPTLKKEETVSLKPFNLKLIAKTFEDIIKTLKYRGYYEFERLKNIEQRQPLENDKPIYNLNPSIEQNTKILDKALLITLKPNRLISGSYANYINHHMGTKLVFNAVPGKPKAFEIYERNKLTIKYHTVLDAYAQLKRDMERLEAYVHQFSLHRNRVNNNMMTREYHSSGFHSITDKLFVISVNDKIAEIIPSKFNYLCYYHDTIKEEKDLKVNKEALLRELKQMTCILGAGLNQKKNEDFGKKAQEYKARERENGAESRRDMEKLYYLYYNYYYVDVVVVDPWDFILYWRSFFFPTLLNFAFQFQVVGDNEFECLAITYEVNNSVDREKWTPEGENYQAFKRRLFERLSQVTASSSSGNQMFDMNSRAMRLRFYHRDLLQLFVNEITKAVILYSLQYMSSRNRG